ncbi:putative ribonuclease H-like domain-containing protein [Tanacetum coccineum]
MEKGGRKRRERRGTIEKEKTNKEKREEIEKETKKGGEREKGSETGGRGRRKEEGGRGTGGANPQHTGVQEFQENDNHFYSVDLKSVVPTKGLTCLFAKATIDESNLWHRKLGHINFKNMNKLVRGNLVRVVAGKQTNSIAGTRNYIVTGKVEKKTKPKQEYILIPFCITDPLISQGPKGSVEEDLECKPTEGGLQVYVDDIIFGSTKKSLCDEFEGLMHKRFQMSSMGEYFFLGLAKYNKRRDSPFDLEAFLDSDYAGASLDREITTRGLSILSKRLISLAMVRSRTIVAKSTTEADMLLCIIAVDMCYGSKIRCFDYGFNFMKTKIYIDNESTIFGNTAYFQKHVNSVKQIHAIVDGKAMVISESLVRSDLLFNDEDSDRPRRQDTTLGGADAQTRPETASKMSRDPPLSEVNTSRCGEDSMEYHDDLMDFVPPTPHDSPLSGGNTPGSDEGRMELIQELMETYTSLTKRVLALEEAKTAQDRVITRLKLRVKRLEKKRKEKESTNIMKKARLSTTTLQPLPTIDPKDKGKSVLVEEEPEKPSKSKKEGSRIRSIGKVMQSYSRLHEDKSLAEVGRATKERQQKMESLRFTRVHVFLEEYWRSCYYMMIWEKKISSLTQEMLSRILNRRIEVDYESEMAFELLRFTRSQLQK